MPLRPVRLVLAVAAAALLAGCGSLSGAGSRLADAITPYKVEVVQGNFVSSEQVQALQKGMTPDQVRQILGTPLVTSLFHGERWDYVFTLKRKGVAPQQRRLTVFFANGMLERHEGDTMPSEAEFVTALDGKRKNAKVPPLQATEEQLRAFGSRQPAQPAAATPAPAPTGPVSYPPLEAPR